MRLVPVVLAIGALLPAAEARAHSAPAPSGLVKVEVDGRMLKMWPFTGTDLAGTASDPINLVFFGEADPRAIRQVLFALGGDRTAFGFPNAFPFNCTWSDAIGRHQTGWAEPDRWQGSAIQLQCGAYDPLRFHLRLFREGRYTLGNVHFDALIPGTTDHEVLAWEFAETFLKVDLARSGALTAPPGQTQGINPAPTYRTIRHQVLNGLPPALRAALGLPVTPQTEPVPIPSDGRASTFGLGRAFEPEATDVRLEYDQPFGQVIPKPFCSTGPLDFLRVDGAVRFVHRVKTTARGRYDARFSASGVLTVTPVNPLTGEPTGPTSSAVVEENHRSKMGDRASEARHLVLQRLAGPPSQSFFEDLAAGLVDRFEREVDCGTPVP
jgi:hypothetical protein